MTKQTRIPFHALLLSGLLTSLLGCAGQGGYPLFAELDRLGRSGLRLPATPPAVIPLGAPEALLPQEALAPIETLNDALRAIDSRVSRTPRLAPTVDDAIAAEQLFARATLMLYDAQPAQARDVLQEAQKLDPCSPAIAARLGEAHLMLNDRPAGALAFKAALECGLDEPRHLLNAAIVCNEERDWDASLEACARSLRSDDPTATPLAPLVRVQLSKALAETRRPMASAEALELALERLPAPGDVPQFAPLTEQLRRTQGDLWVAAGDQWCRAGNFERAEAAYARAAELPRLGVSDVLPRRVHAQVQSGRSPRAARLVIESLSSEDHPARRAPLIEFLRDHAELGDALARAVRSAVSVLPEPDSDDTLRVLIAAEPRAAGRARVLQALWSQGESESLIDLWIDTYRPDEVALAVADASRIVAERPVTALLVSRELVAAFVDRDSLLRHVESASETAPGSLLAAETFLACGEPVAATRFAQRLAGNSVEGRAAPAAARVLAAVGYRGDAQRLIGLDESPTPNGVAARVQVLRALQLDGQVVDLMLSVSDGPAGALSAETLLSAARSAAATGRAEEAERWLRATLERRPDDERAWSELLRLFSPGGAGADSTRFTQTLREIQRRQPQSRLLRFLLARELHRAGQAGRALEVLRQLCAEDPHDPAPTSLMLQMLPSTAETDADTQPLGAHSDWLGGELDRVPSSAPVIIAYSQVVSRLGDQRQAERRLRERLRVRQTPAVARALEQLLREQGRDTEADDLLIARLTPPAYDFDSVVELSAALARRHETREAGELLLEHIPEGITLHPGQPEALAEVARAFITPEAVTGTPAPECDAVFTRIATLAPSAISPAACSVWLAATPVDLPAEQIALRLRASLATDPSDRTGSVTRLLARLERSPSPGRALDVLESLASEPLPNPELWTAWSDRLIKLGDAAHARVFIETLRRDGLLERFLQRNDERRASPDSEIAYELGVWTLDAGRRQPALDLFALAIEYDPNHAWACNNLGYFLADEGRDLDRAEELLERADRLLPGQSNILDSLGWLRFKQGVLLDEPAGREGAISLLVRASSVQPGNSNPTVFEHLGASYDAAGLPERARIHWMRARDLLQVRIASPQRGADLDELRRRLETVNERLSRAADAGGPE